MVVVGSAELFIQNYGIKLNVTECIVSLHLIQPNLNGKSFK